MYFNIYGLLYARSCHQHVSTGIPAVLRVTFLYRNTKNTNVVNSVSITL